MTMPRVHGVELEDSSLCPAWLRDEATEILVRGLNLAGWPSAIARLWLPWLKRLHFPRIIDCCSGSSGPIGGLLREHPIRVTVTDRYPNLEAWKNLQRRFPEWVDYEPAPVDARCLPPDLQGVWSFFNSFHHFTPDDARKVLREAVFRRQPIAIFEALQRRWVRLLSVFLMPLLSFTSILWARPFRWRRLHPLVAFLLTFDGCMSCFRVYTEAELWEMTREVDPEGTFDWQIGSFRLGWTPMDCPYLLGSPRFAEAAAEA